MVTPITPTLLISCSMENVPVDGSTRCVVLAHYRYLTVLGTQDGEWVAEFPEEVEEPHPYTETD